PRRPGRRRTFPPRPPPAGGAPPTLSAEPLDAELGLLSLFSGEPAITRVVLTRPTIELRVTAAGEQSWDAARAPVRARLPLEGKGRGEAVAKQQPGAPPPSTPLQRIRLVRALV